MPRAWDQRDAQPLPADRVALDLPPAEPAMQQTFQSGFRPLLSSGDSLWICQPPPGETLMTHRKLWLVGLVGSIDNDDLAGPSTSCISVACARSRPSNQSPEEYSRR